MPRLVTRNYSIVIDGQQYYSNTLRAALDCVARWGIPHKPGESHAQHIIIERIYTDLPDDNI